ncbi:phosphatidylinositol-3-phosphatase SAC1-like [Apium graveolens]|uniref:phosphatidylinositol-3-phosphatase SAC1-like n=1 Tax=Apium graveolens TaxID=4045 RepID=UPI003D79825B
MAKQEKPSSKPPNLRSTDLEFDPNSYSLEKFTLYETRARFYLIGSDRKKRYFRVLKIDRMEAFELNISEDPVVYSSKEVKSLLQRIDEGNRATGGLSVVAKVYGIAGCIKFLESYYLIVVTKRRQIGCICGHAIYSIDESQIISIPHASVQTEAAFSKTELRYKKLLSSVDLTKDFFYSYTYPIMQSLQKNVTSLAEESMPYENIFVWNAFLTEPIRSRCNNTIWTLALVHGNFKQTRLSVFGRDFSVTLVSRRSRHFAGTRYLKRGVSDRGRVANDVETEQIVLDEEAGRRKGRMSSVVQMRGSIPLFWSQEASRFSPKPDIILQRYDPTYEATKMHFEDVAERYGNPIIVLNLIKTVEKRPREMMLRREFTTAVGYLNQILPEEKQLKFIHWDFNKFAKSKSANVLAVLGGVASEALDMTGFYYSGKPLAVKRKSSQISRNIITRDASLRDLRANSGDLRDLRANSGDLRDLRANSGDLARIGSNIDTLNSTIMRGRESVGPQHSSNNNYGNAAPRFQCGVLRTNCIDCLDRTNVAQYAYGLAALGRQLHAMSLTDEPKVDADSSIAAALMEMYQSMGDALAQQYAGSAAQNTVFPERQGKWKATTQSRELIKSIKRYYSNTYTDGEKQDAINLFLGYFKPQEGKPTIWDLDSDYYLHVTGIEDKITPGKRSHSNARSVSVLSPVPAWREDFSRMKLTSFDKLLEQTCSSIKNVRLWTEPDQRTGNFGMAPDAAEIQLKTPNWVFGQRKLEESSSTSKVVSSECANEGSQNGSRVDYLFDMDRLSYTANSNEEEVFQRYLAMTSLNDLGTLLADQDENSEIYKHYAELCQGPLMEPFQDDSEKEKLYADYLQTGTYDGLDDKTVEKEMEEALDEFKKLGEDLGIIPSSCKASYGDSCQLTRWIIGEDKI